MEKKIIIGISAFVGSNTPFILELLQYLLLKRYNITCKIYSLRTCSLECIQNTISQDDTNTIHIINYVSTTTQIELLKQHFMDETYQSIGIEVPWEECFAFLMAENKIDPTITQTQWRDMNLQSEYRNEIMQCFNLIGTRNDNVYLCQHGTFCEPIGKLADNLSLL